MCTTIVYHVAININGSCEQTSKIFFSDHRRLMTVQALWKVNMPEQARVPTDHDRQAHWYIALYHNSWIGIYEKIPHIRISEHLTVKIIKNFATLALWDYNTIYLALQSSYKKCKLHSRELWNSSNSTSCIIEIQNTFFKMPISR